MTFNEPLPRFQGHDFWTSNNSKIVQYRAIVATTDEYEIHNLSIGTIFNDLERPITRI